jgi:hypothetical protein
MSTYCAILAAVVAFIVIDSNGETERIISMVGVGVLIIFGFVCSAHPGAVRFQLLLMFIHSNILFHFLIFYQVEISFLGDWNRVCVRVVGPSLGG